MTFFDCCYTSLVVALFGCSVFTFCRIATSVCEARASFSGACASCSILKSAMWMVVFAFGHAMAEPVSHVEVPRTGQTSTASDLGRTRNMDVAISKWHVNGSIESKSDNDPHDYRAQLVTSIVDNFQPRQLYPRNATLSGGTGDGDSDPWTPFFAEILDFWRYTRFSFSERSNFGHRAT